MRNLRASFVQFWPDYLRAHRKGSTRICHYIATVYGASVGFYGIFTFQPMVFLAGILGGYTDLHFHDLRHVFATRLQRLGVGYEIRQALLGHKMPGITADYSHGDREWEAKLREAVTRLGRATRWSMKWSIDGSPR